MKNLDDYEIVIFDMDGVLICTREMCMNSYRDVLDEFYGKDFRCKNFPDELLSTFIEIPLDQKLAENGIPNADISKILPRYYEFNEKYFNLNKRINKLIAEVKHQRDTLKKPVYLASLKAEEIGRKILHQTGVEDYFTHTQFRTPMNTKTDVLAQLLKKIGKPATIKNTIYIGDMPYDRTASADVGIDYVDISEILGFRPNFSDDPL